MNWLFLRTPDQHAHPHAGECAAALVQRAIGAILAPVVVFLSVLTVTIVGGLWSLSL